MRWLSWGAGLLVGIVAVASLATELSRGEAAPGASGPLNLVAAGFDDTVAERLRKSCCDCHSDRTDWPWYSHVAPVSWLVRTDVNEGKRLLNFSRWAAYGTEGQGQLMALCASEIKSGAMPPHRYLVLHAAARWNGRDRSNLIEYLERESARLLNGPTKVTQ